MSGTTRHQGGWLLVFLFTAAVGGGQAVGHARGFTGGGHPGRNSFRGRAFEGGRFDDRRFHHGQGGPEVFVFPYFYDPYYGYDPYYPSYPYAADYDQYSPGYAPEYCYWDDAP